MESLSQVAKWLKIELSPRQLEAFESYYQRLISERSHAGLTSLRDRESIERRHFGESLALLRAVQEAGAFVSPVIDIGPGAGFPGVPMRIVRPETELTLIEANGKKAAFLERLVDRLELSRVTVIHARAEEAARDGSHRARYGLALARAVAPLRVLAELALPFLRIGGCLATPKSSSAIREVREAAAALAICGGQLERVEKLKMPWSRAASTLVLVRKVAETPEQFPRRSGMPQKRPL